MRAAIYCRVSGEAQEREGTSLQSQLDACLKLARERDYEVPEGFIISETYSGLTLDRPELAKLRDRSKDGDIGAVIAYTPDRLCRNGEDILSLAKEFKVRGVKVIFVKEQWEDTLNGKLVAFVLGWASELEVAQIKERTMRGKKARALAGMLPANSHARLYGYTYLRGKNKNIGEGTRYINDSEAKWVREMYRWLIEEGLSTNAITYRLRDLGVPTPSGSGYWIRATVYKILTNHAYIGKTYAFTCTYGEPKYRLRPNTKRKKTGIIWKPKEEWVEIPGATPLIIPEEIFNTAQERLRENRKMATRNSKNQYLLHGHIYCARCGRAYWGAPGIKPRNGKRYCYPFYECSGRLKRVTPVRCDNRQHNAKRIEGLVWAEVEKILSQPELVFSELQSREKEQEQNTWEKELQRVTTQLQNRARQKDRIHKAFAITGDEQRFRKDIASIEEQIEALQKERDNLEKRIESNKEFILDTDNLKKACDLVASNLKDLSFEEKRLALQALQIRVLVDGNCITIQGTIPIPVGQTVTTESG